MARDDFLNQEGQGGIRDFEFTVTGAYFASSEKYNQAVGGDADILFLHWIGTTDLDDRPVLLGEDFHPSYKVGPDWTTVDGGKTVTYGGKSKTPRMGGGQGGYGGLCSRVVELIPEGTPGDPLEKGHPSNASIWIGTKWYMEDVKVQPGTQWEKNVLMPTQFLGIEGAASAPTATPTAAPTTASDSTTSTLRDIVVTLAKESATYQEFQAKALQLPNISADSGLIREVLDQSGIYAQAQG